MHSGRAVLWAVLALMLLVSAAFANRVVGQRGEDSQCRDPLTKATQQGHENRYDVPVADGVNVPTAKRLPSRSVSILDDTHRLRTVQPAGGATSPGLFVCEAGTAYDLQHNDLAGKQIVTLGGDPNTTNVHFTWTQLDVIPESIQVFDRFQNYNGYNPSTGLCLGDCGSSISGGGGDPQRAKAGFTTIDVISDDCAQLFCHQLNELNQDPASDHIYSSWATDQGIPCLNLVDPQELPGSEDAEAIWPHGAVDRTGNPSTDVLHVTAHPTGRVAPFTNEIHYWRRVNVSGIWEGPVVLDVNAGPLNHYVTTDPTSDHVSVIYLRDDVPGLYPGLLQVVYMESASNGADWITAGAAAYPTPLTSLGFTYIPVMGYNDPDGPQSWLEAGGEYDFSGTLHVFWVEQLIANESSDCRLRHWSSSAGITTIAQAIGWDNAGDDGARDLWLASPGIAFGDGATVCSDGPANPGSGGLHSNLDYIYVLYEQYGGETAVEQADASAETSQGGPQMNLEFYLSCSNDGGTTWSRPVNLTNTKTPGCDGTSGNECASERDPSIATVVNDAIHIQYILDTDAGDAMFGQGGWSFNPVMYYKITGGADNVIPNGVCPALAPSFAARLTNQNPGCEYHASHTPPGAQVEDLTIENLGNATMTGTISPNHLTGSGWLHVVPSGPYSIPSGGSQVSTVTMDAAAPSIQTSGEGLYQAQIEITHNDVSRPSPYVIPVDFFVYNKFYCEQYVTLHTGGGGGNQGTLWLEISNTERFANEDPRNGGLIRRNPIDGDNSYSIYDGSLIIAVPPNPDTLVYRNIFGAGSAQPGFRALSGVIVDTSAYGTNQGEATAFANQTTSDSLIGIDVEYIFPQDAGLSEFVGIKYRITNRSASTLNDVIVGNAVDFDVVPDPNGGYGQIDAQNTGHLRSDYNLIYQEGTNGFAAFPPDAREFKGGITSIQCSAAPRAWIAPNDPWLFSRPGNGWHEGYLYQEMTRIGFEIFPSFNPQPEEDLHGVMVFEQGVDLTPNTMKEYLVALVSSNTGTDESDLINTTKKAWKYFFGWDEFVDTDTVPESTAVIYPYYAIGSHEDGLSGGCCGCEVTKVSEADAYSSVSNHLTVVGGEPGGCKGSIQLAGDVEACSFPIQATFRVRDLCGDYADEVTINIETSSECIIPCICPYQADYDEDGFLTPLDLSNMIDVLFAGKLNLQDPYCPTDRMDFDGDGFATALDLGRMIDHLFAGANPPCDPCDPDPVNEQCAK